MRTWIPLAKMPEDRRVRVLRIEYSMFLHILMPDGKRLIRQRGLPSDAKIIAISDEPAWAAIEFVIHSESFEPVPGGTMPDTQEVIYEELPLAQEVPQ